jgi:hypothetical protein
MSTALVHVPFHGDQLQAIQDQQGVWCVMTRLCQNLGLAPQKQQDRLRRQPWACTTMMVVQLSGDDQRREVFCLHLRSLAMWLATIETSRVKPAIRPKLERYQVECADVLTAHFFGGARPAPDLRALIEAEVAPLQKEVRALSERQTAAARAGGPLGAFLAELSLLVEQAAERGAARALARQHEAEVLDSTGACRVLGKVYPDGRPNLASLKSFLVRHPDCPVQRVGRRLVFSKVALEEWMKSRSRRTSRAALASR